MDQLERPRGEKATESLLWSSPEAMSMNNPGRRPKKIKILRREKSTAPNSTTTNDQSTIRNETPFPKKETENLLDATRNRRNWHTDTSPIIKSKLTKSLKIFDYFYKERKTQNRIVLRKRRWTFKKYKSQDLQKYITKYKKERFQVKAKWTIKISDEERRNRDNTKNEKRLG